MDLIVQEASQADRSRARTPDLPCIAVTRLRLTAFRCYGAAGLDLDPDPVVLTGPNGAGKTNLLEALSMLAPGRGLRRAKLGELDRQVPGEAPGLEGKPAPSDATGPDAVPGWAVAATVRTPDGAVEIGTGRDPEAGGRDRRIVRIDGATARSQAALAEYVSAVWLTPQMDRLFLDGPGGRRRFLDRLVFGFDPAHAGRVSAYEHAMRERARLLRPDHGPARDPAALGPWLGALERTMVERGIAIAAARREMTARLVRACEEGGDAFPQAELDVTGTIENWLDALPAVEVEERFAAALAAARTEDAATGGATTGPHRSDFRVRHRAKGMPAEQCSTGEQKALLVSIVLADARLQAAERGAAPLLLLDEVAAHLDARRRAALFEEIAAVGAQAWLTGTEAELFEPLRGRAQFLGVENAAIYPTPGG